MDEFIKKGQNKKEGYRQRSNSMANPQVQKNFDAQEGDAISRKRTFTDEIVENLPGVYKEDKKVNPAEADGENLPHVQQVVQKREYLFLPNDIKAKVEELRNNKISPLEEELGELRIESAAYDAILTQLGKTRENHKSGNELAIWKDTFQKTTKGANAVKAKIKRRESILDFEKKPLDKFRQIIEKEADISNILVELIEKKNLVKTEEDLQKLQDYYDKMGQVEEYIKGFKVNCPNQFRDAAYTKTIKDYENLVKELSDTMGIVSTKLLNVENINECCDINTAQAELEAAQNAENKELIEFLEKGIKVHQARERTILRRLNVVRSHSGAEDWTFVDSNGEVESAEIEKDFEYAGEMEAYDKQYLIDLSQEELEAELKLVKEITVEYQNELSVEKKKVIKKEAEKKLKQDISYDMDFIKQLPSVIERLHSHENAVPEPDYASRLNYIADVVHLIDISDRYNEVSKIPFLSEEERKKLTYISAYCKNHSGDFYKTVEEYSMEVFRFQASDLLKQNVDIPDTCNKLTNFNDAKSFAETLVKFYTYNAAVDVTEEVKPIADIISKFATNPGLTDDFKVQVLYELSVIKANLAKSYDDIYKGLDNALDDKKIQGSGRARMLHYMASLTPLGARFRAIEYSTDIMQSVIDPGDENNIIDKVKVLAVTDKTIASNKKHTDRLAEDIDSATNLLKFLYGSHFERGVFALTKVLDEINTRVPQNLFSDGLQGLISQEIEVNLNKEQERPQKRPERIEALKKKQQQVIDIFTESKNISTKIVKLMATKNEVLNSNNKQEKKEFLDKVEKIEQYISELDSLCSEETKKTDAYKNTMLALNTQMDRFSEAVAQIAFETIDFNKIENTIQTGIENWKRDEEKEQRIEEPHRDKIENVKNNLAAWRICIDLITMKREGYILNTTKKDLTDKIKAMPNKQKQYVENFQRTLATASDGEINTSFKLLDQKISNGEKQLANLTNKLSDIRSNIYFRQEFLEQFKSFKNAIIVAHEVEADKKEALESQDLVKQCAFFSKVATLQNCNLFEFLDGFPQFDQDKKYMQLSKRYIRMSHRNAAETAHQIAAGITRQMVKPIKQPTINVERALDRLDDVDDIKKMVATAFKYRLFNGEKKPKQAQLLRIYNKIEEEVLESNSMDVEKQIEFIKELYKARVKAAKELVALYNSLDKTYGQKIDKNAKCYLASRTQAYRKYMAITGLMQIQTIWTGNKQFEKLFTEYVTKKSVREDFKITEIAEDITLKKHELENLLWLKYSKEDELDVMYNEVNQRAVSRAFGN